MINDTLGIALVGCGGMASRYRANYTDIPGCKFRLVVDVQENVARGVAAALGVERASTDWRAALAPDIDIVDISTPNHLHVEQATALLAAGKHVILQKPMAPSVEECRAIVEAATRSGTQAAVYMSDLEDPLSWDLRDLVAGGYLGNISSVRARYAHRGGLHAQPHTDGNWRGSVEKTGGGSFMQLSIHHINLLSWILGDEIESVMGYSKNLYSPNIGGDDTATAVGEFKKTGALCIFDSAWNADRDTIEIYGTQGSAIVQGGQGAPVDLVTDRVFEGRVIHAVEPSRKTHIPASGSMAEQCGAGNPLNQHIAFVRAVQTGQAALVPAATGMRDVAVVKALYRSAEEGRRISIAEIMDESA